MHCNTPLPLEGVKVVELSHLIAGPYCCQMLADEGATVIKVEPPGGELTRHRHPARRTAEGEVAAYYASLNRNKKSVVLDLKNEDGAAVMNQLLASSDVFVTNMRAAALERLGLAPEALHQQYPRLVVVCISGFGLKNADEYADRAGLAIVAEGMSGAIGLTKDRDGSPIWCGFPLGDVTAAVAAHASVVLALRNQERFGIGKLIDLALIECMLPMVSVALGRVQVEDEEVSDFAGSNAFHGIPYGAYRASDGGICIGVNRDDFWKRLCDAMGRPECATDPRYATYVERMRHHNEVHAITDSFARSYTRAEIIERLVKADVPVAPVYTMQEVLESEYLRKRGALWEVDDGYGGKFVLPANVAWFERPEHTPRVPRLGEHRDNVLCEQLGLSASDLDSLELAGAFGPSQRSLGAIAAAASDLRCARAI